MPITTAFPLNPISQSEFGRIAYEVTGLAFEVHRRLGLNFDESVYRNTLTHLLGDRCIQEFTIKLTHGDFAKKLFIDLVVDYSCPFELKACSSLHDRHRNQLIQYLMLTELRHGKLINFGTNKVQHEFVNCHETMTHRRSFQIHRCSWSKSSDAIRFEKLFVDLLRDWGTGLDQAVYLEAMTHFLGGEENVKQPVDVSWNGKVLGQQLVHFAADGIAFEITSFRDELESYERHLSRFLSHVLLHQIFWVNIASGLVQFNQLVK